MTRKKMILTLITLLSLFEAFAQKSAPASKEVKRKAKIEVIEKNDTTIKNPLEMRDPFKRKRRLIGKRDKNYGGYLTDGKFSNVPTINDFTINQIRVVGVLLGGNRRAIAKVMSGNSLSQESYIIKEGMKIGENDAEVKAIVPGGIVLVEKIRNVYDQDEYIETIIPVSRENL